MKKFIIFGALFGLFIIPLGTLGLGLFVAELLFAPFIIIPRWLMTFFVDIASGSSLLFVYLITISVLWYTFLSLALGFLFKKTGKRAVVVAIVIYYLVIVLLGVSTIKTVVMPPSDNVSGPGDIKTFEECVAAGNSVMESYPRKCRSEYGLFVENIGNEMEKIDLIRIDNPRPNQQIISPLKISGQARGPWFFEGDFPIVLTNWDGLIIAEGYARAEGEWMTEEFVPFTAELNFIIPDYSDRGTLILHKDNASGLPENDNALEIPIKFKKDITCGGPSDVCLREIECDDGFVTEDTEVCGKVNVQCITTPCDPILETFKNMCEARDKKAFDIKTGSCEYWSESDKFIQITGPIAYSLEYPRTWFVHETEESVVFTQEEKLDIPKRTEGYAIGPNFIIKDYNFTDSNVKSYVEWMDMYGMTDKSEYFVSGSNKNINGYQMGRIVTNAAGAGGQVLHYVFFVDTQRILVISQYPYGSESIITKDFEKIIRAFKIGDN